MFKKSVKDEYLNKSFQGFSVLLFHVNEPGTLRLLSHTNAKHHFMAQSFVRLKVLNWLDRLINRK